MRLCASRRLDFQLILADSSVKICSPSAACCNMLVWRMAAGGHLWRTRTRAVAYLSAGRETESIPKPLTALTLLSIPCFAFGGPSFPGPEFGPKVF
jgi:hypothetical protein